MPAAPRTVRTIHGPEDVVTACRGIYSRRIEQFAVLLLNARHEVMRRVKISMGSLNASIVHPREVFRPAIWRQPRASFSSTIIPAAIPSRAKRISRSPNGSSK